MSKTKKKILVAALELFNQYGLVNVRLQQIADQVGISVGNLAYHYYGKEAIVMAIDEQLTAFITPVIATHQVSPTLIDYNNLLASYYFLIKNYSFYFLDFLEMERAYPKLHAKRIAYIRQMIAQIEQWMQQSVEKGILQPATQENQYQLTAHTIWMIITFWLTQGQVRGIENENEGAFKASVWNQLLPFFTPAGLLEYEVLILPQIKYYVL